MCLDNKHSVIQYYMVKSVIYVLGSALGQSRTGLSLIENIQQFVAYDSSTLLVCSNESVNSDLQLLGLDLEYLEASYILRKQMVNIHLSYLLHECLVAYM